jgi:hypothetical protein
MRSFIGVLLLGIIGCFGGIIVCLFMTLLIVKQLIPRKRR